MISFARRRIRRRRWRPRGRAFSGRWRLSLSRCNPAGRPGGLSTEAGGSTRLGCPPRTSHYAHQEGLVSYHRRNLTSELIMCNWNDYLVPRESPEVDVMGRPDSDASREVISRFLGRFFFCLFACNKREWTHMRDRSQTHLEPDFSARFMNRQGTGLNSSLEIAKLDEVQLEKSEIKAIIWKPTMAVSPVEITRKPSFSDSQ